MSKRRQYSKVDSDSDVSSSESEVEYEPIVVADADGNQYVVPAETNPLAPLSALPRNVVNESIQISPTVRPMKVKAKKGKIFVSKDRMLSLIESVNTTQDAKIKEKLDRDVSFMKRSSDIEESIKARKEKKDERLEKIKDHLRKGGVRLKGENKRKVREINEKKVEEKKVKQKVEKFAARKEKSKRKVRFAE